MPDKAFQKSQKILEKIIKLRCELLQLVLYNFISLRLSKYKLYKSASIYLA
jgi:hypothetical protein